MCIRDRINTADDETKKDESGYYLTVTGTSAEMGDDGSVGRGNRANGLITPNRPCLLYTSFFFKFYFIVSFLYKHDKSINILF